MKKILFVDEHKVVNYAGGVERILCDFANEFIQRGYEISIVCMDAEEGRPIFPLAEEVKFANLAYLYGENPLTGLAWLSKKLQKELLRTFAGSKMIWRGRHVQDPKLSYFYDVFVDRLSRYLGDYQPDIILTVTADGAGLAKRAMGKHEIPVIAMCHTDPIHFRDELTERQIEAWRSCSAVQVLMPLFAEFMETELGLENVVVIPNIVVQVPDEECRDLTEIHHRIVTVGRIDGSSKRQHLLLEAFALLAKDYPEWVVEIYGAVGNKRYQKLLEKIVKDNHLERQVFFGGQTDDVPGVLAKTDIFAFPSEYEGFGLALAEALSFGIPGVGVNDCSAVQTLIGAGGIVAAPEPHAYAEALRQLLDDAQLRCELGYIAHNRMKEYRAEGIWNAWEDLLGMFY